MLRANVAIQGDFGRVNMTAVGEGTLYALCELFLRSFKKNSAV